MTRRRTVLTTAFIAAILAAGSTTATVSTSAFADANCLDDLEIVADHAGGGYAPGQTGAAFLNVDKQRPQQVRLNVRVTADRVPVLVADDNLQRITNIAEVFPERRNAPVSSFTLAELRRLDAGSWYDARFSGERIVTLREVLEYVYSQGIGVSIVPKDLNSAPAVAVAISDELHSDTRWDELLAAGKVSVSSDSIATLETMASLVPAARSVWTPDYLPSTDELKEYGSWVDTVGQDYRGFDPSDAVVIHEAGMTALVWGVNSPEAVTESLESGANVIVTEYPGIVNAICANRNPLPGENGIVVSDVVPATAGSDVAVNGGEHVTITNTGDDAVDVSGYYLRTTAGHTLTVGDGHILGPGDSLRVYTGPGADSKDQYFNGTLVNTLHNDTDTLALYTPDDVRVAMFSY